MIEGVYAENILNFKEIRPYPVEPQDTSGVTLGSQSIYKYALQESDYPTLSLVDEITNGEGDKIPAGHYELALSNERDFLILMQSKKPVAIIPVFKVEEDISQPTKKQLKIDKKIEKEREKTNKKRAKKGLPPDVPQIHMEASIEYNHERKYYLIKYERNKIRAWGAIK